MRLKIKYFIYPFFSFLLIKQNIFAIENKINTISDDKFVVPASREFKLNEKIKPCHNFYSYVCSLENTNFKMPESKSRYIYSFNDSAERIKTQRLQYIKSLDKLQSLSKPQAMIRSYYQSCMDSQARLIEEKNFLKENKNILNIKNKDEILKKFAENSISGNFNLIHIFDFVNRKNANYNKT